MTNKFFLAALVIALGLFALSVTVSPPFLNTDDLFYGAWAGHFGKTGQMWAPDLARQFPGQNEILVYPPLHIAIAGGFFRLFGFSATTADVYTSICALLTSLGSILIFYRLGLERAMVAAAPLGFVLFSFSGLRPEVTSGPLFTIGLALLLARSRGQNFVGRTLLFLAPTAAPTVLGPAAAVLAAFALYDIFTKRNVATVVLDSLLALGLAVVCLGAPIGFRYPELVNQVAFHYGKQPSDIDFSQMIKASILLVGAYVLWKRRPAASLPPLVLAAIAAGVLLGMAHTHAGTSILLTYLGTLLFISAITAQTRWASIASATYLGIALAIYVPLPLFWLTTRHDLATDQQTKALVDRLRAENRTILVDDIAGKYLYNFDVDDKIGWHWARPFPGTRPNSLDELGKDDVWVVSRSVLVGYLRSETPLVKYLNLAKVPYKQAKLPPCVMGRMSCRLPARRFDYIVFWRDRSGQAFAQDMIADPEPRPIS